VGLIVALKGSGIRATVGDLVSSTPVGVTVVGESTGALEVTGATVVGLVVSSGGTVIGAPVGDLVSSTPVGIAVIIGVKAGASVVARLSVASSRC
jgi:hypothetical protein